MTSPTQRTPVEAATAEVPISTHWKDLALDSNDPTIVLFARRRALRAIVPRSAGRRHVPDAAAPAWCGNLPEEPFNPVRKVERRSS